VLIRRGNSEVALGVVVVAEGEILSKLSSVEPTRKAHPEPQATVKQPVRKGVRPVAAGRTPIVCKLPDGRQAAAIIIGRDPENDLCLLKIALGDLKPITWAKSPRYDIGRWVISPAAQGAIDCVGVISSKRRSIPAEHVPGVLGVQVDTKDGPATIRDVFENSAAASAGLEVGDVIEKLGDAAVGDGRSFIRMIRKHEPGDVLQVQVKRKDEAKHIEITLGHPFGLFLSQYAQQIRMGSELSVRRDGFADVFAHDGGLRPEECGGPLVDLSGAAIGVNIARSARMETLALPAEVVQASISKMRKPSTAPATAAADSKTGR
jgi:serine protease Do